MTATVRTEDSKTKVLAELEKAGNRAIWVHAGFGDYPGIAPEINGWCMGSFYFSETNKTS